DVNGDGVPDFATGAPQNGSGGSGIGYVRVFSGTTGAPLCTIPGAAAGAQFGTSVAGAGDVNGDGFPDVVGGAPLSNAGGPLQSGAVRVHSVVGIPAGSSLYGSGCAGSGGFTPLLAAQTSSAATGNASFGIVLSRALGGSFAVLDLGLSSTAWLGVPLPLDLGFLGLPGCSLLVSAEVPLLVATNGSGPGNGRALVPLPIPPDPTLPGAHVFFQWYVVDPGPALLPGTMSPALDLQIL
ncbi:MAG TPA: integrin alpha, partial [Planctomycetota bacterium]|nr:integrin alpha [Planctomycetota bacterium]